MILFAINCRLQNSSHRILPFDLTSSQKHLNNEISLCLTLSPKLWNHIISLYFVNGQFTKHQNHRTWPLHKMPGMSKSNFQITLDLQNLHLPWLLTCVSANFDDFPSVVIHSKSGPAGTEHDPEGPAVNVWASLLWGHFEVGAAVSAWDEVVLRSAPGSGAGLLWPCRWTWPWHVPVIGHQRWGS